MLLYGEWKFEIKNKIKTIPREYNLNVDLHSIGACASSALWWCSSHVQYLSLLSYEPAEMMRGEEEEEDGKECNGNVCFKEKLEMLERKKPTLLPTMRLKVNFIRGNLGSNAAFVL
jgi:hypothetical protein